MILSVSKYQCQYECECKCQCDCLSQCECHEASFRGTSLESSSRGPLQASLQCFQGCFLKNLFQV